MRKSILVVDDDQFIQDLSTNVLGVDNTILVASNCKKAREILKSEKIDLILLDINLEGETTEVLFKELKNSKVEDIPIVVFSGSDDSKMRDFFLKHGVADYISKPYNFNDLGNRIKTIFQENEKNKNAVSKKLLKRMEWVLKFNKLEIFLRGELNIL